MKIKIKKKNEIRTPHPGPLSIARLRQTTARQGWGEGEVPIKITIKITIKVGTLNAEEAVAGIAQAGEDIPFFIQLAIHGGGKDGQMRIMRVEVADAFR